MVFFHESWLKRASGFRVAEKELILQVLTQVFLVCFIAWRKNARIFEQPRPGEGIEAWGRS